MIKLGLIGYPLEHSFSPQIHTNLLKQNQLSGSYELIPLPTKSEFEQFMKMHIYAYKGVNVTIPYKRSVLPYCNHLSAEAKAIQAINTIVIKNNELIGYNTDCMGFMLTLLPYKEQINHALILGTGGSSAAVKYVLDTLQINHTFVSRNPTDKQMGYQQINSAVLSKVQLLVNCTPLGMFPNENQCPTIEYSSLSNKHLCIDLVYNPATTLFMKKSAEQGATVLNGKTMLEQQAQFAFELFTQ